MALWGFLRSRHAATGLTTSVSAAPLVAARFAGNEMSVAGDLFRGSLRQQMRGAVMRKKLMLAVAVAGACAATAVPTGTASADDRSAQQVISDLQSQGYTVNIDRIGSGPMDKCVVTNVRNPQQVTQWVPYIGPGNNGDRRALVLDVTSQTISVTLDCNKH
jgi:hypothetical protein